ncbi:MAG: DUF4251 domain-containing protein [Bacteroidales bacterium]|nr:DUF4251 domain-containing protein [Bacteroidales bacterium]
MKTMKIYMAGLLILTGLFIISINGNSQDVKPDKKSRKEARRAEMEINFRILDSLLYNGKYVLEADYLQNKYGSRIFVSSTLNYIRVDMPKGVLQTGSDTRLGYNGVGGVTAEGNIGDYKITRNLKNLSCTVTFNLVTNIGSYNIILFVSADNNATATISGTTSGRLSWNGHLVYLDKSRVFKGYNSI